MCEENFGMKSRKGEDMVYADLGCMVTRKE